MYKYYFIFLTLYDHLSCMSGYGYFLGKMKILFLNTFLEQFFHVYFTCEFIIVRMTFSPSHEIYYYYYYYYYYHYKL